MHSRCVPRKIYKIRGTMKRLLTFAGIFLQFSGMAVTCGGLIWFFGKMGHLMTATMVGMVLFGLGQIFTRLTK